MKIPAGYGITRSGLLVPESCVSFTAGATLQRDGRIVEAFEAPARSVLRWFPRWIAAILAVQHNTGAAPDPIDSRTFDTTAFNASGAQYPWYNALPIQAAGLTAGVFHLGTAGTAPVATDYACGAIKTTFSPTAGPVATATIDVSSTSVTTVTITGAGTSTDATPYTLREMVLFMSLRDVNGAQNYSAFARDVIDLPNVSLNDVVTAKYVLTFNV